MGGICSALGVGFSVLVAQRLGARDELTARSILRQSITFTLIFASVLGIIGIAIAPYLPIWLGGNAEINHDATIYFFIFAAAIPIWELNYLMTAMLRAAGNMRVPSIVNIAACIINVALNYIFIFVCQLGVLGAALGTFGSFFLSATVLTYYVFFRTRELSPLTEKGSFRLQRTTMHDALHIGIPVAIEHIAMCSAHIMSTVIVAPLGTIAIAANSFGITIEGLCYMPGYGIGDAATTLVGQSVGAKRPAMQRSFAYITLSLGVAFMTVMGIIMYIGVPYLMPLMTPNTEVQQLTTMALRIEAFAEPAYAASIVAYSVFVGAGDTLVPCLMNLGSIWLLRLPLALYLVSIFGLRGFWLAMAIELVFRGTIFMVRFLRKNKQLRLSIHDAETL